MDETIIKGLPAVAAHFGKSLRQVQRWAREGMPRLSGKRFDLQQIQAWLDQKQGLGRSGLAGGSGQVQGEQRQWDLPPESGKDFWDKESKKFQAKARELEYRRRRGELVERQEVEVMFVSRILAVKQGLLTLSRGLPPQLIHCRDEREMEDLIARAVRTLLEGFCRPLPESSGGEAGGAGLEMAESG